MSTSSLLNGLMTLIQWKDLESSKREEYLRIFSIRARARPKLLTKPKFISAHLHSRFSDKYQKNSFIDLNNLTKNY